MSKLPWDIYFPFLINLL